VRRLELTPRGSVAVVMPFVINAFRAENKRMMKMLKGFAEGGD
jgi:hypothetical protein